MVEVTQADRNCAAAIYRGLAEYGCSKTSGLPELIADGMVDDNLVVQNAARHRQAAIADLTRERDRLQVLLNGRDAFIVSEGLWHKFVDHLSDPLPSPQTGDA
jgi:hypothetical protein